jgi:hypothetical protein
MVQVRNLLVDLPVFMTSPIGRRWHLHWGAAPDEVVAPMAGDALHPHAQFRATRAITIAAPPERDHDRASLAGPPGRAVGADVTEAADAAEWC